MPLPLYINASSYEMLFAKHVKVFKHVQGKWTTKDGDSSMYLWEGPVSREI